MSDTASRPSILVHGFLICRNVRFAEGGRLNLEEVLEIVPVESLPGDAGPLTFVAFVRGLPVGPGKGAFVIGPAGRQDEELARLPIDVEVPQGYDGRQIALQVRVPSIPVESGGFFDVVFEWEGETLAVNRFAVGARATS